MVLVTSSGPLRGPEPAPGLSDPAVSVVKLRRRLAPGAMREHRVNVRLSGDELRQVQEAARLTGLTPGGYVAAAAVAAAGGTRPPRVVPARVGRERSALLVLGALQAELRAVGVNINQMARHVNGTGEPPDGLRGALLAVAGAATRVTAATLQLVDER